MLAPKHSGGVPLFLFRWSAKILSIASTALLLLFVFGEKFEASKVTGSQWLAFVFFPLGIVVGYVVAWWKEGLGGGITIASLLIFYLIFVVLLRGDIVRAGWFLVFAIPGFLFLASSAISRARRLPEAHT